MILGIVTHSTKLHISALSKSLTAVHIKPVFDKIPPDQSKQLSQIIAQLDRNLIPINLSTYSNLSADSILEVLPKSITNNAITLRNLLTSIDQSEDYVYVHIEPYPQICMLWSALFPNMQFLYCFHSPTVGITSQIDEFLAKWVHDVEVVQSIITRHSCIYSHEDLLAYNSQQEIVRIAKELNWDIPESFDAPSYNQKLYIETPFDDSKIVHKYAQQLYQRLCDQCGTSYKTMIDDSVYQLKHAQKQIQYLTNKLQATQYIQEKNTPTVQQLRRDLVSTKEKLKQVQTNPQSTPEQQPVIVTNQDEAIHQRNTTIATYQSAIFELNQKLQQTNKELHDIQQELNMLRNTRFIRHLAIPFWNFKRRLRALKNRNS